MLIFSEKSSANGCFQWNYEKKIENNRNRYFVNISVSPMILLIIKMKKNNDNELLNALIECKILQEKYNTFFEYEQDFRPKSCSQTKKVKK